MLAASNKEEPNFWDKFWAQYGSKGNRNSNGNGSNERSLNDMGMNRTGSISNDSIKDLATNPIFMIRSGAICDLAGNPIGYMDSDGTIRDLSKNRVGSLGSDGRRYTLWGNPTNMSIEELIKKGP